MSEDIHLLITEPEVGNPSTVMKVAETVHGAGAGWLSCDLEKLSASAVQYPPFANCAKDGAPTVVVAYKNRKPGPPARSTCFDR
jgi:hypothetical protein